MAKLTPIIRTTAPVPAAPRALPATRERSAPALHEATRTRVDLSVVIPTLNERDNIRQLVPALHRVCAPLGLNLEVLVVDGGSRDGTCEEAAAVGARVLVTPGLYGEAIRTGLRHASGEYVVTMDADLSHEPEVVARLWEARDPLTIAVASRYVRGGSARTGRLRLVLSRILNAAFSRGLSLPIRDLSSGFRIYPADAARRLHASASDFDILVELLVRAYVDGWRVIELPFRYAPRRNGSSKARAVRLGRAYLRTFVRMWRLRNSIEAADYDERAFDSPVPLQRAWQRRRHALVTRAVNGYGRVLDVGCGSSRILRDLRGAVGLDVAVHKLRYMRRYDLPLVAGSIFALPFLDASIDTIVCSEVIEHIPAGPTPFHELARVQRPGGRLILGTPDYGTRSWRWIESLYRIAAPGGYADEHITQYTHERLRELVIGLGYRHLRTDYVFGSEMILTFEKIPERILARERRRESGDGGAGSD